ncbi:ABC transporter ATP-binding protein [Neorhizobium sp. NCHU2750]|uniref:ABC transporter ATP-binding protein n=1 Tax=Neorhizobium sp. NCHU2750 TaxID=1825976 RepID=UPI000E71C113|nr:spermidine/putrescine ABC transporter ATP-binding protein [Neorhizobium sp. NCHU2750]
MTFLSIRNVAKHYQDFVAVHDTNIEVGEAEFISLLGPSGCGKTTTLQMIAGFIQPTRGQILLQGRDLTALDAHRRGLGVVFQSYALFPHMTAEENVSFGLELRKVPAAERRKKVADALELVGLGAFGTRYPRQMSGGQQQRVALARALVINPPLLLLDEPLSNLDAKLREDMQTELRRIQRSLGTTTILVTHDQGEAMALSDRIVVMDHGRVEQIGRPEDVYDRPATEFVARFLGRTIALKGEIIAGSSGTSLKLGELMLPWSGSRTAGPVTLNVRPERMLIADHGLPGRVTRRCFQGAFWLCTIETEVGEVEIIHPNAGTPCPREGELLHLAIDPRDLSALSEKSAKTAPDGANS